MADETGDVAKEFIAATITTAGAPPRVVHADRGTSMTFKPVALLLADLGVVRSPSRPKVSNTTRTANHRRDVLVRQRISIQDLDTR